MTAVRKAGARIEELLGALRPAGGGAMAAAAGELVRLLLGLYGDGLGRIMAALDQEGAAGDAVRARLLADPAVESLLLLHDLHPLDVDTRIQRALDRVRPYLGSHAGGVRYLGVDAGGVAHLRLEGSCHGCPSAAVTVRLAIEGAVQDAAPEVSRVAVEGVREPPDQALLQIGPRPPAAGWPPGSPPPVGGRGEGEPSWVPLPPVRPPEGRPCAIVAGGVPVLVCQVSGTLYAYRDACGSCGSSLAGARLAGDRLGCPACGARYDVRAAGRDLDDPARHLDPLPLLADGGGVRVAVPEAVGGATAGRAVGR